MAAKKLDPKAKAKKQKIVAGGLAVALLGVLAFSVPKTMKMMNSGNVTETTATTAPATTPTASGAVPLAPPTLDGTGATPAAPAANGSLVEADSATTSSFSHLVAFDRFKSKDPFDQQVSANGTSDTGSSAPSSGSTAETAGVPPSSGVTGSGSSASPTPSSPAGTQPPAPMPTTAVISVNGGPPQTVAVNVDFPLAPADPLFHVLALMRTSVKITIVGGSYASGAPSAVLKKGKPLVLVNTADGTRYELKLLWLGTGQPPASLVTPPTGGGAATPATPASTPASTPATTPATTPAGDGG
jgi:hypothetical protein